MTLQFSHQCRFASKFKSDLYSVIAIFPADITLPRIRVWAKRLQAKRLKSKNGVIWWASPYPYYHLA